MLASQNKTRTVPASRSENGIMPARMHKTGSMPVSLNKQWTYSQIEPNLCAAVACTLGSVMIFPVPIPVPPISAAVSANASVIIMFVAVVISITSAMPLSLNTPGCFACIPAAAVPFVLRAPPVILVNGHAGLHLHH